jgi:hypothetical protein
VKANEAERFQGFGEHALGRLGDEKSFFAGFKAKAGDGFQSSMRFVKEIHYVT